MPNGPPKRAPLLRHPIAIGLALAIGIGLLTAFSTARAALFLGFAAILMASLMSFPVNLLTRWMPRGLAVVVTIVAMLALVTALIVVLVPTLSAEGERLTDHIAEAADRLQQWMQDTPAVTDGGKAIESTVRDRVREWIGTTMAQAVPASLGLVEGLLSAVVVLVLGAFFVHRPGSYRHGLLRLVPISWEDRAAQLWDAEVHALRHWVGGMLVSMAIMGTLTGLGLWIAGIDGWPLLAVLTFFGTFVPYAGAIATAIPGLVVGLAQSPAHFFYALLVYVGVHVTEGYIVQPMIMKRAVHLQPALLLFWQALMTGAFGVIGVIGATPLLVAVQVMVQNVYIEGYLGRVPEPVD